MAVLYDITLRIFYRYGQAVDLGRHLVRVMPLDIPGKQKLGRRHLAITPGPADRVDGTDFFGNHMVEIGFDAVGSEVELLLKARVERRRERRPLDISPSLRRLDLDIAAMRELSGRAPHHFLGQSARIGQAPQIIHYAKSLSERGMTALEAVQNLGEALHRDMNFLPGATDADTRPEDAFERREGVCQDYAHIMIAALRGLGVPAGYVSGFLRTIPPEGQERLEGSDAMHAWVTAWCGRDLGWVEYDPTNAMFAAEDHVVVGYGRDYSDISPIKGVTRSAGMAQTGHSVDVVASDLARPTSPPRFSDSDGGEGLSQSGQSSEQKSVSHSGMAAAQEMGDSAQQSSSMGGPGGENPGSHEPGSPLNLP
ncbi:MAG: transglutaminase family protein [Mangrovicoccus sp.]